ncbi:MAG: ZIP family metal transporter [Clostridia bacterium]|nr:ZIP family metal transporter [Clostridia bacterium]
MTLSISLFVPLLGTALGAAMVFFFKDQINEMTEKALLGFASGIMIAASVFSLIIPAIDMSREKYGAFAFVPASVGFILGIIFLLLLDILIPHLHVKTGMTDGRCASVSRNLLLIFSVTLHNIPEGMAIGVAYAGTIFEHFAVTPAAALALSIGIAIQNIPEGAVVSLPLVGEKTSKAKAFLIGVLSGAVEPVFGFFTVIFISTLSFLLPYLLAFAAGAMFYVVVEELIPEANSGKHSNVGTVAASAGFVIMMILDVALG